MISYHTLNRKEDDCVICALAIAAQIRYEFADKLLEPFKANKGVYCYSQSKCVPLLKILKNLQFRLKKVKNQGKTLKSLQKTLKKNKTFLVFTGGPKRGVNHVSCWRDGVMEDWAARSLRRVISIYEVRE